MGGLTFTKDAPGKPAIHCPRLPPHIYFPLKAILGYALQQHFILVSTPYEAPEKPDHGDIDFLVHNPTTVIPGHIFNANHVAKLTQSLGAVRSVSASSGSRSFAVPVYAPHDCDGVRCERVAFAQIDVTSCSTPEKLHWQMLTHSYGDLFQILGVQLRPVGLTFLQDGFAGRVTEAVLGVGEDDEVADPSAVLAFLGLDEEAWKKGFASLDECFSWIAAGRLFDRRGFGHFASADADDDNGADENTPSSQGTSKSKSAGELSSRQRRRDRDRRHHRPMYRDFVDVWLPAHPDLGHLVGDADADTVTTRRAKTFDEALKFFGKRSEYEELLVKLKAKQAEDAFWSVVRKRLPVSGRYLGDAMRGLKRWVDFVDLEGGMAVDDSGQVRASRKVPRVNGALPATGRAQPVWTRESGLSRLELLEWVDENWGECRALEARVPVLGDKNAIPTYGG